MSRRFLPLPPREEEERLLATAPHLSAWVSANAGSGKTTILKNRVIRLLLEGVAPDRILCLTFTKAAAAEMQSRVFDELARWIAIDDAALAEAIDKLAGPGAGGPARLMRARRLFAEALETPGGLKIQTIHAFAERILHLFPLEAGVPVDFSVLEESEASGLAAEARRAVLARAAAEPRGSLPEALDVLISACGLDSFAHAVNQAVAALMAGEAQGDGAAAPLMIEAAYAATFGVGHNDTEGVLEAAFLAGMPSPEEAAALALRLAQGRAGKDSGKTIEALGALAAAGADRLAFVLRIFQTKGGKIRDRLFENADEKAFPEACARLTACHLAAAEFVARRKSIRAMARSRALRLFASEVLAEYRRAKAERNALDFDDLIAKLRAMLASGHAGWVMRKLDAAIEHILVDEAQDTTPAMWEIVGRLADDFFSGEGQARRTRTLFVVGDEKQSIFSFQGADPAAFERTRQQFAALVPPLGRADGRPNLVAKPVQLAYSYRSSGDVLGAVDCVFADPRRRTGLSASGEAIGHIAADDRFPGAVELWPIEEPEPAPAPDDPARPVDALPRSHPSLRAAERIAREIRAWLDGGARHARDGNPIAPGDILVLVRSRNGFFNALMRELRLAGIPVAGADRLALSGEIVIADLKAVAQAALLPEDDLTLAAVLKSPLVGLDDQALEALCRGRPGSLRDALRMAAGHECIKAWLTGLEALAGAVSPFAFFARLLNAPCPGAPGRTGRAALLTRLGPDAADPVDAFLGEALEFGRRHPPALTAFLAEQEKRESVIKRDLDQGAGQVRVMTVHASKGLEARIVILADALGTPPGGKEDAVFRADSAAGPLLLWAGRRDDEPEVIARLREHRRQLAFEEYRRLLYVGLTRAADRLIVTAYRRGLKPKQEKPADPLACSWYELVRSALAGHARVVEEGEGERARLCWRSELPPAPPAPAAAESRPAAAALPDWLTWPAPAEPRAAPPLRPSRRSGPAFDEAAEPLERDARRHGILVHRLFEHLPGAEPGARHALAAAILRQEGLELDAAASEALVAPVLAAITAPEGARLFGPASRAEVRLAGSVGLPDGRAVPVAGRIDRLVVDEAGVDLVDIKSGRPRRAAADAAILRQMALYAALAGRLFPGRKVTAHVLWAATGELERLPEAALAAALINVQRETFTAG